MSEAYNTLLRRASKMREAVGNFRGVGNDFEEK
jgi:hypothetical protein